MPDDGLSAIKENSQMAWKSGEKLPRPRKTIRSLRITLNRGPINVII